MLVSVWSVGITSTLHRHYSLTISPSFCVYLSPGTTQGPPQLQDEITIHNTSRWHQYSNDAGTPVGHRRTHLIIMVIQAQVPVIRPYLFNQSQAWRGAIQMTTSFHQVELGMCRPPQLVGWVNQEWRMIVSRLDNWRPPMLLVSPKKRLVSTQIVDTWIWWVAETIWLSLWWYGYAHEWIIGILPICRNVVHSQERRYLREVIWWQWVLRIAFEKWADDQNGQRPRRPRRSSTSSISLNWLNRQTKWQGVMPKSSFLISCMVCRVSRFEECSWDGRMFRRNR